MDDVETAECSSGAADGLQVCIEARLEQPHQWLGMMGPNGSYEISVGGRAINSMRGAGHGTAEEIRNTKRFKCPNDQQIDLGLLGIHQSAGGGPYAFEANSGPR